MDGELGPMGSFGSKAPSLNNPPGSSQDSSDSASCMETDSEVSHQEIVIEAVVHAPADTDSGSQRPNPVARPPAVSSVSLPGDRNAVTTVAQRTGMNVRQSDDRSVTDRIRFL